MNPRKPKKKKPEVLKTMLATNDQVTLNLIHNEKNSAALPPKSQTGLMRSTLSSFPAKKRKKQ